MDNKQNRFMFSAIVYPYNVFDAIVVAPGAIPLEIYQKYITENNIEKADIMMPNLEILKLCPNLKYLRIDPFWDKTNDIFDCSPIYDMPEVKFLGASTFFYNTMNTRKCKLDIDYSRVNGLVYLAVDVDSGKNYNKVETLKSIVIVGFKGEKQDLTDMFCSKELDRIRMGQCKVSSLNGIENAPKMKRLSIEYSRTLADISALSKVKDTLMSLTIENCPNIKDFSVLYELENLEYLHLLGSNTLPNLDFIKSMKKLKWFHFSMDVIDGDLSPCLNLARADTEKNRRHYNLKDKELPKGDASGSVKADEKWRLF